MWLVHVVTLCLLTQDAEGRHLTELQEKNEQIQQKNVSLENNQPACYLSTQLIPTLAYLCTLAIECNFVMCL